MECAEPGSDVLGVRGCLSFRTPDYPPNTLLVIIPRVRKTLGRWVDFAFSYEKNNGTLQSQATKAITATPFSSCTHLLNFLNFHNPNQCI